MKKLIFIVVLLSFLTGWWKYTRSNHLAIGRAVVAGHVPKLINGITDL